MSQGNDLEKLISLVRHLILRSTTAAGSGHPTSSLSATDLMVALMFGGIFKFDLDDPSNPANDRLIFSKGHASPLFYALYTVAGKISEEELMTMRKFSSRLEGHPMPSLPYTEAATGSLGQGLSIGAGMALAAKRYDRTASKTYVLLGDSEMAEGSVWEAIQWAAHEKLDNLVGILDVNRLGQSGETMLGHEVEGYAKRIEAFGWRTVVIDGHNLDEIAEAYRKIENVEVGKPTMIIAKTMKGKGISFLENKEGWHGKTLSKEELEKALQELGSVDVALRGAVALPTHAKSQNDALRHPERSVSEVEGSLADASQHALEMLRQAQHDVIGDYKVGDKIATRKAYGTALAKLATADSRVISLDAETKNSTFADEVLKKAPAQYVEMYIAEQNMVGVATGLARRGYVPFCSTFAAFFTRAFDQIRMAAYSQANIKCVGSHVGVSIGEDGPSQMGLEDLAQFRAIQNSVVLYPADAVAAEKLAVEACKHEGLVYIRTTRAATPVIYGPQEVFAVGGSKIVFYREEAVCTIVSAGITLHEAIAAGKALAQEGIGVRVLDCYSVKPLDEEMLLTHARGSHNRLLIVEDHHPEGGLGEAVAALVGPKGIAVTSLAVRKAPKSGKPEELMAHEEIDAQAIIRAVKQI